MKRVFKGKRGQAGIGENIGNILQTMPTPLKILLFLAFLVFFLVIFGYILNMFGVHCSSEDDVYLLPVYDAYHNIKLIFDRPSIDAVNSYALQPEQLTIALSFDCVHKVNETYYFEGAYCTDCENVIFLSSRTTLIGLPAESPTKVCEGDVYPNVNKGWFKKIICNVEGGGSYGCDVPTGYFFNSSTGYLHPQTENLSDYLTVGRMWDNKIKDLGGRLISSSSTQGKAYDDAFRLSCSSLTPTIKFFGIPIFDFRVWLFLILIAVVGGAVYKIHSMDS